MTAETRKSISEQQTAIQHVLSRLKSLGVTGVFSCPGDFVYAVCDANCDDPGILWINCTNELNASYAADGYAHTEGLLTGAESDGG